MRIGYIDSQTAHPHSLEWWAHNRQDPDRALHLVRTWAFSPWLQECQQRLGHALHAGTPVPNVWKELVIVRVCGLHDSRYELYHHAPLAAAAGIPTALVKALRRSAPVDTSLLGPTQAMLVELAEAVDAGVALTSQRALRWLAMVEPDQLVALVLQVGYWGCNARFANAMELDDEPWMAPGPSLRHIDPGPPRPPRLQGVVDAVGAFGVPPVGSLDARAQLWMARWDEPDDALVRLWSWVDDIQVANQRTWDCLRSERLELDPSVRGTVALLAAAPSVYLTWLLETSHAWVTRPLEPELDTEVRRFVRAWQAGVGIPDPVAQGVLDRFGPAGVVELQLIAGFMGAQARLCQVAGLAPPENR